MLNNKETKEQRLMATDLPDGREHGGWHRFHRAKVAVVYQLETSELLIAAFLLS
jgi:hypothetical protein